mmetsp:Transcript_8975/g.12776  ORF Transcript_8975/g.12776 Transcript_8975/m.12776 type:complete len:156 (-) Transcript_8975:45-512(-)
MPFRSLGYQFLLPLQIEYIYASPFIVVSGLPSPWACHPATMSDGGCTPSTDSSNAQETESTSSAPLQNVASSFSELSAAGLAPRPPAHSQNESPMDAMPRQNPPDTVVSAKILFQPTTQPAAPTPSLRVHMDDLFDEKEEKELDGSMAKKSVKFE